MSFFDELKRRNVIRVAVAYLVAAWVLAQIATVGADALGAPDWIMKMLITLLAIGLVPTLFFSWVYELTPEGLKKESDVRREDSVNKLTAKKLDIAIIVLLVGAIGLFAIDRFLLDGSREAKPTEEIVGAVVAEAVTPAETVLALGVAVLPFANMSPDQENAFFASGVHGEILNNLAKIGNLKVISRTSVLIYSENPKNLREIAEELGVSHIVEGSVRRFGNRVRVSAQLIDVHTDEHMWTANFARDLTMENIILIQSEIAQEIAAALEAEISPEVAARIAKKPTENLEAYDFYLRGLESFGRPGWLEKDLKRAQNFFSRAVELDPNFALAHARLSMAHSLIWDNYETTDERLEKILPGAKRALELDPGLPQGHFAMGWFYYDAYSDFERALTEFAKAEKGLPGSDELLEHQAWMYWQSGRHEEAIALLEKAFILNPNDPQHTDGLAWLFFTLRRIDESESYVNKTLSLAPESSAAVFFKASIRFIREGRLGPFRSAIEQHPDLNRERWWIAFHDRDYEAADEFLSRMGKKTLSLLWTTSLPKSVLVGITAQSAGDMQRATKAFDSARVILEREIINSPRDAIVHSALGFAYAGLNRKEDAVREGIMAVRLQPITKDAMEGPGFVRELAMIYTMVGQPEEAISQLELFYAVPNYTPIELLKLDPRMDPLRDHPRFRALVEKYRWKGGERR